MRSALILVCVNAAAVLSTGHRAVADDVPASGAISATATPSDAPPSAAAQGTAPSDMPTPGAPVDPALELPPPGEVRAWDRFHLDFTAGLWLPRVTGDVSADSAYKYGLVSDLGLSSMEPSFAGELEARCRAFHVRVGGAQFETSGGNASTFGNTLNGLVIAPGDPTASTMSMWNFGGDIGVDLYRPLADHPFAFGDFDEVNWRTNRVANGQAGGLGGVGGYKADLRLGAFVGVRAFNTDLSVSNLRTDLSTRLDETWTVVYVGGRATLDLYLRDSVPFLERISIDADASFGPAYPGSGSLVAVRAGVTAYPCDNFGIQFGYRLQKLDGDGAGQHLQANFAGLFVGGVLHF